MRLLLLLELLLELLLQVLLLLLLLLLWVWLQQLMTTTPRRVIPIPQGCSRAQAIAARTADPVMQRYRRPDVRRGAAGRVGQRVRTRLPACSVTMLGHAADRPGSHRTPQVQALPPAHAAATIR